MKFSINILYRSNFIYNDIDDMISIINSNTNLEVNIYNFLNNTVLPKYNTIDFDKTIKISHLIRKIFNESDEETYKIILDSNIKYNNINIDSINTNNNLIHLICPLWAAKYNGDILLKYTSFFFPKNEYCFDLRELEI
mgnify:CR=1 FL=1